MLYTIGVDLLNKLHYMQFPNGAGYFDYEDVPTQQNYEENTTCLNDNILLEGEAVE